MPIDNIDEIDAYHNKDGTFAVELYGMVPEGQIKITLPRASLDLSLYSSIESSAELEVKLKGCIERM